MSFLKVLVIGDVGTGKTSLVNRIVYNTFTEKYKATIGCEFGLKILDINGEAVRIQLWDLAGQDRLGGVSRLYCRDANGALVISDLTREETISKAADWKHSVDENVRLADSSNIPMVLCLNKADAFGKDDPKLNIDLEALAEKHNYVDCFYTSARTGANANEALERLVREIMKSFQPQSQDMNAIFLNRDQGQKATKKKACCN